jgi:RimJ/RimL family protein N-acetyltransferase
MTATFSLRPLAADDAEWIFEACQDLEIQKWTQIPRPYTREHAVGFAKTLAGDVEVWVIDSDSAEKPYGVIGVHSIDKVSMSALIGYWIAPWGRRQGAMKAGLKLYSEKASAHPDIASIRATIAEENIASRRSAESVGFALTGDSDESCNCGGVDVKAVTYEWRVKPVRSLLTL